MIFEKRECRGCGAEFQPRNPRQVYCRRECAPDTKASYEMNDAELRLYMVGFIHWLCQDDPEKIEKLTRYFENPSAWHGGGTLAEVIGPYQQQEVFFTDAD